MYLYLTSGYLYLTSDIYIQRSIQYQTSDKGWARATARAMARAGISNIGNIYRTSDIDFGNIGVILSQTAPHMHEPSYPGS